MKFLFLLLLAPLFAGAQDSWTGPDKPVHLIGFGLISFALARSMPEEPIWKPITITTGLGILKEVGDKATGGKFSGKDVAVDVLGALIGAGVGRWSLNRRDGKTTVSFNMEL